MYKIKETIMYDGKMLKNGEKNDLSKLSQTEIEHLENSNIIEKIEVIEKQVEKSNNSIGHYRVVDPEKVKIGEEYLPIGEIITSESDTEKTIGQMLRYGWIEVSDGKDL